MSVWTDLLGAEVRCIDVAGTPTRLVELGEGRAVLLLHGRGGHLETWRWVLPRLALDRRTIAVDLLGHGLTAPTGTTYDVGELLHHVVATLDRLKVDLVDIVGQSLGGWVAAQLARVCPHRVRRLVLIEPAGLQSDADRLADPRIAAAFERGGRAFTLPSRDNVFQRLRVLVADEDVIDDELVDVRQRLYSTQAARAVHLQVRAAENGRWQLNETTLAAIDAPTLFIRGDEGHTPAAVVARAVAAMPNAVAASIPGARQWPHYERPDRVVELITRHLDHEEAAPNVVLD